MNSTNSPSGLARQPLSSGKDYVKVHFDLLQDELGYPPANSESMWAVPLGQSLFRLDNIPFFASGVSCFDVVLARTDASGLLKYERLVEAGGHSTLRVIFCDNPSDQRPLRERITELTGRLREIGCSSELCHIPRLISIDIPPEVEIAKPKLILDAGQRQKLWEYEEATLAHSV